MLTKKINRSYAFTSCKIYDVEVIKLPILKPLIEEDLSNLLNWTKSLNWKPTNKVTLSKSVTRNSWIDEMISKVPKFVAATGVTILVMFVVFQLLDSAINRSSSESYNEVYNTDEVYYDDNDEEIDESKLSKFEIWLLHRYGRRALRWYQRNKKLLGILKWVLFAIVFYYGFLANELLADILDYIYDRTDELSSYFCQLYNLILEVVGNFPNYLRGKGKLYLTQEEKDIITLVKIVTLMEEEQRNTK